MSQGVIDLQDKLDSYRVYSENTDRTSWDHIRACISEAPNPDEMRSIIEGIGPKYQDFEEFYGAQVLEDAIAWGKDLKDRYTVLWLYNQYFA